MEKSNNVGFSLARELVMTFLGAQFKGAERFLRRLEEIEEMLRELSRLDIDLDAVSKQLEEEGIEKFNKPYDALMKTLMNKRVRHAKA